MTLILPILLTAIFALSSASIIQPRDLKEDAEEQLGQLRNLVNLHIDIGNRDLNVIYSNFRRNGSHITDGIVDFINEYNYYTIRASLYSMINLAEAAGYDVTPCTDIHHEETFREIARQYIYKGDLCVRTLGEHGEKSVEDTRYVIDVYMTQVHDYERKLSRCEGNAACMSPLLAEIVLKQETIPHAIKIEVQATKALLDLMLISTQACVDPTLAAYKLEADTGLEELQACLDRLTL